MNLLGVSYSVVTIVTFFLFKKRSYKYAEEICGDVLSDLFRASGNESLRKTDNLEVSLSKKMNAVNNVNPALLFFCHEALKVCSKAS